MPSGRLPLRAARQNAAFPRVGLLFYVVSSLLLASPLCCARDTTESAPLQSPADPKTNNAVEIVLKTLEKNPVDVTGAVNGARPCCLKKALENSFKGHAEAAARTATGRPWSEDVWTALLPRIRKEHWIYNRDADHPELDRFEDLKKQCGSQKYFQSVEEGLLVPLPRQKVLAAGLANLVLLSFFAVWRSVRASKTRRPTSRRRHDREEERRHFTGFTDNEFVQESGDELRSRAAVRPLKTANDGRAP
ncbi:hypothetical protein CSUI_010267 [Cystoisospora suis]|uniref:Transmembrane protein n=1 Tax=Cystoisospora suis TaxID=483139 RepID=A0A2C6JCE1_9APIC|nr:hypothetical protein CSUI_010267 [Cystoisospora suis]